MVSLRASWRWSWKGTLLVLWLSSLAASHALRLARGREGAPPPQERSLLLHEVEGERLGPSRVRLAYEERSPLVARGLPLVLLHGSPGGKEDLERLASELSPGRRTIRVDLPGFGRSTRALPDTSVSAHARYLLESLDRFGIERAHVLGFSMGGGAAIELGALAPRRVASLVLVSSIGVQELELLGDYGLNHALHALQLGAFWALAELAPHFGLLDGAYLSPDFARNFYDTDQRRLRGALAAWGGPLLLVHGEQDPLVPVQAALEHHRIVPQSELALLPGGHLLVFQRPAELAGRVEGFLERVERGEALSRSQASPAALARASEPWDPARLPPLASFSLALVLALAALATLASEDLACIAVGGLVAGGRVPFVPGALACLAGIFLGDVLLFLAGRWLGPRALARAPCSWFLRAGSVQSARTWLERRGLLVILLSRFLPGTRLPTYFACGALGTGFWRFTLWFALAGLVWTPALVGFSAWLGSAALARSAFWRGNRALLLMAIVLAVGCLLALARRLATRRARRLLQASWQRTVRFEYWPRPLLYAPVVVGCLWEGLRRGKPLAFTAANPAIPHGGFVGESKSALHRQLERAGAPLPATLAIGAELTGAARVGAARAFRRERGLAFPLVVKPDAGQRGDGVRIVRDARTLEACLAAAEETVLLQEHVAGEEFGVFYVRHPRQDRGRILSLVLKELPSVTGDGARTLEELILDDPRTLPMSRLFLETNRERLDSVPAAGERVALGELGSHCRGARFSDGRALVTPELLAAIDRIARALPGFFFGRFDLRSASVEDLRRARFTILELNGVTSEAAHIYDPAGSPLAAWRTLLRQWRLAYEIGAANARAGARVSTVRELAAAWLEYRRTARRRERALEPGPGLQEAVGAVALQSAEGIP